MGSIREPISRATPDPDDDYHPASSQNNQGHLSDHIEVTRTKKRKQLVTYSSDLELTNNTQVWSIPESPTLSLVAKYLFTTPQPHQSNSKPANQTDPEEEDPSDTHRTATRKVEIKKANARYILWKDMYDSTKARVEALRAATDPDDDAIMEELANLSKDLDKYNKSVKEKKLHLDKLISQGCQGEVEVVVYDPANNRKHRDSTSRSTPHSPGVLRKRQRMNPKHRNQTGVINTPRRRSQREVKSTQDVTASDLELEEPTENPPDAPSQSLFTCGDIDLTKLKVQIKHITPSFFPDQKLAKSTHSASLNDILEIIKDVTPDEARYIRSFIELLPSNQFNWGQALGPSVANIIFCWTHAMPPPRDIGDDNSIGADIKRLIRICTHQDMINFLKTAPRIMQMSTTDQFFKAESINWELLEQSIQVTWKDRNGLFKALHAMACRTDNKLQWTSESGIQSRLKRSYSIIHQILLDSIRNLSHNTPHIDIKIKTTGEHAVPLDMVDIAKGIGGVYQQIMVRGDGEDGDEIRKVNKNGMEWLQRRYLLVLIGLMLVYEGHVYNQKFEDYKKAKRRTQAEVRNMKKILKDASCLNQLSSNWVQLHPDRAIKPSQKAIDGSNNAAAKVSNDDMRIKAVRDASELRSEALRALSLFLLYGTAGLFHVWPALRELLLHDSSYLINFTSILATRFHKGAIKDKQVYYDRAWSCLDNHMMTLLSQFVSNDGAFRKNLDWPGMTVMFSQDFDTYVLSPLFILDLTNELYTPGHSRTPGGLEAPHVLFEGKNSLPLLSFKTNDLHDILTISTGDNDDDDWSEKREKARIKGKAKAKSNVASSRASTSKH
ncbi:uncharacterized protein MELLADRAFT_85625 [Melampsora larici-populina 98AG31]|uniref:Uncharacterized protein n=1 Tax=Melampsora larici-populina (strain 98AG31 / pathotype 3-4-7) TaxID=747676 RepID=F4RJ79_MELLP|nr:uncharacterized protein MELLADRAFT_85625 [Melampsora larici-populina 98AG31]EGG07549.1 hypothetical protein MELLADRAFT_85625 [Melampsora larici-populina 98AG31]